MTGSVRIILVTSSFGLEALIADITFPNVSARAMGIAILDVLIQRGVAFEVPAIALLAVWHVDGGGPGEEECG